MQSRKTNSSLTLTGRIDRKTHNVSDLRDEYPDWDDKSRGEKLSAARDVEPVQEETVYNVTTDALHRYFVDNLDPGQTDPYANITTLWIQLGTGSPTVSTSDSSLSQPQYEEEISDAADNGKDLLTSTFLDSTEGNGNTFEELGLWSGDPTNSTSADVFLINHATFSPVSKDNTKTVTFDVTLTFSDV